MIFTGWPQLLPGPWHLRYLVSLPIYHNSEYQPTDHSVGRNTHIQYKTEIRTVYSFADHSGFNVIGNRISHRCYRHCNRYSHRVKPLFYSWSYRPESGIISMYHRRDIILSFMEWEAWFLSAGNVSNRSDYGYMFHRFHVYGHSKDIRYLIGINTQETCWDRCPPYPCRIGWYDNTYGCSCINDLSYSRGRMDTKRTENRKKGCCDCMLKISVLLIKSS